MPSYNTFPHGRPYENLRPPGDQHLALPTGVALHAKGVEPFVQMWSNLSLLAPFSVPGLAMRVLLFETEKRV